MADGIPRQLLNKDFRFIIIEPNGKKPLESGWQNYNNYQYYNVNLMQKILSGYNYGVVCGYGNLAVIDADKPEIEFIVQNRLPRTFTVKTGSGGTHFYYFIPDLNKKIVLMDKKSIHYGEIQWKGAQVVGPNSIHPNGNKYRIIVDAPIATISNQHILEIFDKYIVKQEQNKSYDGENQHKFIDISKLIDTDTLKYKNGELVGAHPTHGSSTGNNFSINIQRGVWHCFRCGTGGGPVSLIAILNGLMQCCDSKPGAISNEMYQKIVKIAKEKYGVELDD